VTSACQAIEDKRRLEFAGRRSGSGGEDSRSRKSRLSTSSEIGLVARGEMSPIAAAVLLPRDDLRRPSGTGHPRWQFSSWAVWEVS
jgi:hypothetical protein